MFVFDAPPLERLQLSSKRLVYLTDTLAELAVDRRLELRLGDPVVELAGRALAVTFSPVPGFAQLADRRAPVEIHPWPWLRRPGGGPITSFTAWRRAIGG